MFSDFIRYMAGVKPDSVTFKTSFANADFVIEGYLGPREPLRDEGPFGDHTGYYTLPELPWVTVHQTSPTPKAFGVAAHSFPPARLTSVTTPLALFPFSTAHPR